MALPPLPYELWDAVFDEFQGDKSTLKACSLVCREWRNPSQRNLFSSRTLSSDATVAAFKMIVERAPALAIHVRRLNLTQYFFGTQWMLTSSGLPEIWQRCVNVRVLVFKGHTLDYVNQAGIGPATFPLLKERWVEMKIGVKLTDLTSILLRIRVENLTLNTICFSPLGDRLWPGELTSLDQRPVVQLRALHIAGDVSTESAKSNECFILGCSIGSLFTGVKSLTADFNGACDITTASGVIASLGPHLQHLCLNSYSWHILKANTSASNFLDLSSCTSLQSLSLSLGLQEQAGTWITLVSSQVTSSVLHTVKLSLPPQDAHPDLDIIAWDALDLWISRLQNLRVLMIMVDVLFKDADIGFKSIILEKWSSQIHARLPRSNERGVLNVNVHAQKKSFLMRYQKQSL